MAAINHLWLSTMWNVASPSCDVLYKDVVPKKGYFLFTLITFEMVTFGYIGLNKIYYLNKFHWFSPFKV